MKTFDTSRLSLRRWTSEDMDDAYRTLVVEQDDEPMSVKAVIQELQFDDVLAQQQLGEHFGRWAVVLKAEQKIIGTAVLMPVFCSATDLALIDANAAHSGVEVEIGYALSKDYRGQGYATEASRALLEYGFETLKLARIIAYTTQQNSASIAVLEQLGMRLVQAADSETVIGVLEKANS